MTKIEDQLKEILELKTKPENVSEMMIIAITMGVICAISFLIYYGIIGILTYQKEIAVSAKKTQVIKIVGGLWLTKEARNSLKTHNLKTQELFKGAAYSEDRLWSRSSQGLAKSLIIILFIFIITCGTLGLTTAGFVIQVKLTGKPAAEVIEKKDLPGLNNH